MLARELIYLHRSLTVEFLILVLYFNSKSKIRIPKFSNGADWN